MSRARQFSFSTWRLGRLGRRTGVFLLALLLLAGSAGAASPVAIAVHGGAGTLSPEALGEDGAERYRQALREALRAGYGVLTDGGTSLDAVQAAITLLEASPLFNAGVGAVLTWDGQHELDASLMQGADLRAGAVAGVRTVASPIALARAVMDHSPHVLLSGRGAEAFAKAQGLPQVANDYFTTERRQRALQRAKERAQERAAAGTDERAEWSPAAAATKWGTVGAVALDAAGNLAAGTSTGGMTAKRWGRVGDSPLIGAGTWADNRSCAVSATGHGEYFIRYNVAADICARVRFQGLSIDTAANTVIFGELLPAGGTGGVIVLSPNGEISMPFNTPGMYRGSIDTSGQLEVAIHARGSGEP